MKRAIDTIEGRALYSQRIGTAKPKYRAFKQASVI